MIEDERWRGRVKVLLVLAAALVPIISLSPVLVCGWVNYDDHGGLQPGSELLGIQTDLNFRLTGARIDGCPADLDGNGTVGFEDILAILAAWGECPNQAGCPEDLDDDGDVGFGDLLIVLAAWGPCE